MRDHDRRGFGRAPAGDGEAGPRAGSAPIPGECYAVSTIGQMRSLTERLDDGCVLVAEGYLFELERRGYLKSGPFVPEVVLDFPDAVRELHREFLRAGSDV